MWSGQTLRGTIHPGSMSVGNVAFDQSSPGRESIGSTKRCGATRRHSVCSRHPLCATDWFLRAICATRPGSSGGFLGQGNRLLGIDVFTVSIWKTSEICEAVSSLTLSGHVNRGYSGPVGAMVVARGNGPVALPASHVSSENSSPDERPVWMSAKSYVREEQSLGWIRSQRLPYRSRKTATVP